MHRPHSQEPLPDMPPLPNIPVRLGAPNALARALQPGYIGLDPEAYLDISPEVMELASAAQLRPSLVDVDRRDQGAVGYVPHGADRPVFVTVTPREFGLLAGNVETLGRTATSRSLEHRGFPQESTPEDVAASHRAGAHAVEGRLRTNRQKNLSSLEAQLDSYMGLLGKFQEAAEHPGLARFGNESGMRTQLTYLRMYILGDLLTGVGYHRGWSAGQADLAQRALDTSLFIKRSNNEHLGRFKSMLNLAEEWNGHKLAITRTRMWQSRKYLRSHES